MLYNFTPRLPTYATCSTVSGSSVFCKLTFQFSTYGVFKCRSTPKIVHGKSKLHDPAPLRMFPNTGVFESCHVIADGSPSTKKVVKFPVPGTVVPSGKIFGMPLGFKFNPPPLNMNVRIDGCE